MVVRCRLLYAPIPDKVQKWHLYHLHIKAHCAISISLSAQQTESINSVHHDNPKSIIANEFAKFVLLFCVGARAWITVGIADGWGALENTIRV